MTASKKRPRVWEECWVVEWCTDLDDGSRETAYVATESEAKKLAAEVWPQTVETTGIVEYWLAEFWPFDRADAERLPHAGYWRAPEQKNFYEGEDQS